MLSREVATRKKFKYGKRARLTQKELFDPYKDELPFLKNPLFITIKNPYEVDSPRVIKDWKLGDKYEHL